MRIKDRYSKTMSEVVLIPTSDPRGFGPIVWQALHTLAVNYPKKASKEKRLNCIRFLYSLSHLLPCIECGRHFRKYLDRNNCKRATQGKENLVSFLVAAHNKIKKFTGSKSAKWTTSDAKMRYKSILVPRPLPNIWPTKRQQKQAENEGNVSCSCS